jgi:hypothetical protein
LGRAYHGGIDPANLTANDGGIKQSLPDSVRHTGAESVDDAEARDAASRYEDAPYRS